MYKQQTKQEILFPYNYNFGTVMLHINNMYIL